jgi:pimeloyl-ACP methyl ester carboxylesterase
MAAKKKKSSRKPRTARKSPVQTKARDAAEALGNARTIIHVHGIGNKPPAEVLKCQWDTALMGFDLGERSRLAYWVNRAYYPEPSKGSCATGDLVTSEDLNAVSSTSDLGARATPGSTDLSAEISRLARDPAQKKILQAIADQMQGPPSAAATKAIQARRVEPKILPLPEPARRWFTRKLTSAFLRDVSDFFYDADRRAVMMNSVIERIEPGGGPFVVIGHSQGSMIAYAVLQKLARERTDLEVPLFVTIGSPLGIKEVQDELRRITQQAQLAVPGCVGRWLNVADPLDPVAFDKWLKDDFRATNGVRVEDELEWNKDSPRHPHSGTGYLQTKPVRRAVRDAVDTGVFQPVSKFVIARGVVKELESASSEYRHKVLIELVDPSDAQDFSLDLARETVTHEIVKLSGLTADSELLCLESLQRFVAARLTREETEKLAVRLGTPGMPGRTVSRVWRNSPKRALLESSINTVQARPAHTAYRAVGSGITWGVLDTGVTASHPHFATHGTIKAQFDCTKRGALKDAPADDQFGHGTHVAGIIAGRYDVDGTRVISGIAPNACLHIYKVLDDDGFGDDASVIKALDHIASTNERAGRLVVHGINLSLGGSFDQSSYACGYSPLCRELRRLWRQGVVVVIAAGNEGFAELESTQGPIDANIDLSIGDPANLEDAIAVGSVHKENPYSYGISYFSSRGPTADGRQKPDCVAPGERILSCRHDIKPRSKAVDKLYVEMSGTSMAAPHVSGVLAAFLSMRKEFIGQPDAVKRILLENCADLGRDRPMQGAGMPNLMKMLLAT